jgi:putative phosphoribosyl transferase
MDGYADRAEAGRRLAPAVARVLPPVAGVLVLGLPRGGVPVAAEVAAALPGAALDVLLVRKLGVPEQPELAFGAIASAGAQVLNPDVLALAELDEAGIAAVTAAEARELARRERAYRGDRPPPAVAGRTVVADDGLATGATMRAAILALRTLGARQVVAAAPVGSGEACALVGAEADALACPLVPPRFVAVGHWYEDFGEVGDDDVRRALAAAAQAAPGAAPRQ